MSQRVFEMSVAQATRFEDKMDTMKVHGGIRLFDYPLDICTGMSFSL